MTEAWSTKYGPRRVRHDPPTLDEAIVAAQGLTDDREAQAEIAASLMDLPVDKVREAVMKAHRAAMRSPQVRSIDRGSQRAVVVEQKVVRRPLGGVRPLGSGRPLGGGRPFGAGRAAFNGPMR